MVNKQRAAEMALHAMTHGEKATMEKYDLNLETWNRYKRLIRQEFGQADVLMKIREQYGEDELRTLASGTRPISNHNATLDFAHFTGERIKFGIISDTHFGSKYTNPDNTLAAIREMERAEVNFIVHPGDVVEGMMGRPGDVYELSHIGFKAQRDEAIRVLKEIKVPFYAISGNHDMSLNSKHGIGLDIVEDICAAIPNAVYLGFDEGDIHIKNVTIRLFHGGDSTSSYALSYRGQKLIEGITGGQKPSAICAGHCHKALSFFYRNIHYIEAGTMQYQSAWMRGKRLAAHTGFWIVEMCINAEGVAWFQPRWYPIYK